MTKKIFITGAGGRVGRHLIKPLLSAGHSLFLLSRANRNIPKFEGVQHIFGDLTDVDSYKRVFKQGIDYVLHMAAVTHTNDIKRYYRVNAEGTLNLVRLCENFAIKRFIFISTRALAENGGDYSRSKIMAERSIKESSLDWVILRLSEVYGLYADKGITTILNNMKKSFFVPIVGKGNYYVAPVYITDVIFSIIQVIKNDSLHNKIYTIAGPDNFRYNDFIDYVLSLRQLKKKKIYIPLSIVILYLEICALLFRDKFFVRDQIPRLFCKKSFDISDAKKDFAFRPISVEDAIRRHQI